MNYAESNNRYAAVHCCVNCLIYFERLCTCMHTVPIHGPVVNCIKQLRSSQGIIFWVYN